MSSDLGMAVTGKSEFDWLDSLRSNIIRSTDGGESWARIQNPCPDFWFVGTELVDDAHTWAFCAQEGAAGAQGKAIYVSHHAGHRWRLRARVGLPDNSTRGHLSGAGYTVGMDFDARGLGFLWGDSSLVTTNGGAKWRPLGLHYDGENVRSGAVVGRLTGFVLRNRSLLRTTDGGRAFERISRFEPLGDLFSGG
jgi:photosystem II stability/assembly factor-like uncharacterized protein